jgi:outer membrane protein TolC
VKQSITAAEGGAVELGLEVPFLRGAGHVAREALVQLERELTYAVRTFERFRRAQLVDVAQGYFNLLVAKQALVDAERSYQNFSDDFNRARALEDMGQAAALDTLRAEQAMLSAENSVLVTREELRSLVDQFKILIGMPVDEPLDREDLEDIESVERQIETGVYPLMMRPAAIDDEGAATGVALARRLDLRTLSDRIDDARRGVAVSKNALLPDLNWTNRITMDTDPLHYNVAAVGWNRAVWRSELLLSLPLERFKERNDLRRAMIGVRQAEREHLDAAESIRAEVRRAVHRVVLADKSVAIQRQNVVVAERRQELARYRFEEFGDISNRDKVEAENELLDAKNRLNLAKRTRWVELLQFRLATETLRIDEGGRQEVDFDMPCEE